jgi:DHA3 family macrolide efflux protein-like MFS transporter
MHNSSPASRDMRIFVIVWLGQLVSQLGSGLTTFALGVWVLTQTGSVTRFALMFLAGAGPAILISPLAGALVDRWNRRSSMMACNAGLAVTNLAIIWILSNGPAVTWPIYVAVAFASALNALHWPAYSTVVPFLVPPRQFGRANGMMQGSEALSQLLAPAIAGILLVTIKIQGVLMIDCATFLVALISLKSIKFPEQPVTAAAGAEKRSLFDDALYGWSYIAARRGLLGLMAFFAFSNFLAGFVQVLAQPLVLSFASPAQLGAAVSIGGCGMLVGSVWMSISGGPKRRIHGILGFHLLLSLAFILLGLQPSLPLITASAFVIFLCLPVINGSNRALMNTKVAPDVQGRIFATSHMIASLTLPLSYVIAGPLADKVFGPLLTQNGPLAHSVGEFIGVGPGRGIGLLFVVLGILAIVVTAVGYSFKPLRLVERELPDVADESTPPEEAPVAVLADRLH